jgi:hypothetical protein
MELVIVQGLQRKLSLEGVLVKGDTGSLLDRYPGLAQATECDLVASNECSTYRRATSRAATTSVSEGLLLAWHAWITTTSDSARPSASLGKART